MCHRKEYASGEESHLVRRYDAGAKSTFAGDFRRVNHACALSFHSTPPELLAQTRPTRRGAARRVLSRKIPLASDAPPSDIYRANQHVDKNPPDTKQAERMGFFCRRAGASPPAFKPQPANPCAYHGVELPIILMNIFRGGIRFPCRK